MPLSPMGVLYPPYLPGGARPNWSWEKNTWIKHLSLGFELQLSTHCPDATYNPSVKGAGRELKGSAMRLAP